MTGGWSYTSHAMTEWGVMSDPLDRRELLNRSYGEMTIFLSILRRANNWRRNYGFDCAACAEKREH
jgi:hypothetical protein